MLSLMYLFLVITYTDGTQVVEAKGPAGATWDDCIKYASYVQYQEKYPRAKAVAKRETVCRRQ